MVFKAFTGLIGSACHVGNSEFIWDLVGVTVIVKLSKPLLCLFGSIPCPHTLQHAHDLDQSMHRVNGGPFFQFSPLRDFLTPSGGSIAGILWLERWGYPRVVASHTVMQFHVTKAMMGHHPSFRSSILHLPLRAPMLFLHSVWFFSCKHREVIVGFLHLGCLFFSAIFTS